MLLVSLFFDDMYTYPIAILDLFADSQVVRVVMIVVLLPREEGLQGLRDAALALAFPLKQLRAVFEASQLGEDASPCPTGRRINRHPKMMILLRDCQRLMLAPYILVLGEDSERRTPIVLTYLLTLKGISFSGPRHIRCYGMITTTLQSA
jgi:hypothetical protein